MTLGRMSSRRPLESFSSHAQRSQFGRDLALGRHVGFIVHVIVFVMTCALLLVTAGFFPALIVALAWGIGLACHGLFAVLVPALRTRSRTLPQAPMPQMSAAPRSSPSHPPDEPRARALEELSAAIAHEIRNPITAAKSLVQQILEEPAGPDTAEHARVVIGELDRVERSIAHLLRFAREEPFEPVQTDLNELIDSAIDLVRDRAQRGGVRIERDVERLPSAYADGEQLRKVLANLLGNALDAHAERPRKDAFVRVTGGQNLAGNEVWIRVRDNGPGIAPAARGKLFRPFYTSKPGGTGLGLALAHKVLARHHGSIELVEHAGDGAEFLLTFPRRAPFEAGT
jgi:signal transduction histidine kinase